MSYHLTYLEAVVTGLIQGVTELFPVSSLGHNVLIPALVGGSWAKTLDVSAKNSPYLAFVVGLHVATAIAMIVFFWRDWVRIVRGFLSSIKNRSVSSADQRLAWMIILATIPVGLVGATLQKTFTTVFAKPEMAATFLAVNGVILLLSERMRRSRDAGAGQAGGDRGGHRQAAHAPRPAFNGPAGGPGSPGMMPPRGYSQQPQQQQWQGPESRHGREDDWFSGAPQGGQHGDDRYGRDASAGQPPQWGQGEYGQGEYGQGQQGQADPWGQPPAQERDPWSAQGQYGQGQYGQGQYGQGQQGQGQQGQADPWGQPPAPVRDPWSGHGAGNDPWAGRQDPWAGRQDPWASSGQPAAMSASAMPSGAVSAGAVSASAGRMAGGDVAPADPAIAADQRLSTMGYSRAVLVGTAQVFALFPGISRDGIVTVTGMWRGLRREDAVRFSFLLSAPVILAAGALKAHDLTGPLSKGIHGPIVVGSLISGIGAYLSIRFLTKYFSEDKSLNPFGLYCLVAGLGSLAYLVLK
jgi:undecaprenyl pyrophosphate phosphatase UppP